MKNFRVCPKCNKIMKGKTAYDKDYDYLCEVDFKCTCGFHRHWAYGSLVKDDSEYKRYKNNLIVL